MLGRNCGGASYILEHSQEILPATRNHFPNQAKIRYAREANKETLDRLGD